MLGHGWKGGDGGARTPLPRGKELLAAAAGSGRGAEEPRSSAEVRGLPAAHRSFNPSLRGGKRRIDSWRSRFQLVMLRGGLGRVAPLGFPEWAVGFPTIVSCKLFYWLHCAFPKV